MRSSEPPGGLYRVLKVFTDIRPGEAGTAFLLTLNVFLLLLAYYLIKDVREALVLTSYDARVRSYLAGAQAILFIFIVKGFSRLASKVPRHLLITWVTLFFMSNLGLFYLLFIWGLPAKTMAVVFFIWVGIFNLMAVAQFWSFANDIYTDEAGKRLFPMIAVGSTCGAVIGAKIAGVIIKPLGPHFHVILMLMTAGILGICIALTIIIHRREIRQIQGRPSRADVAALEEGKIKQEPLRKGGGFRLVFRSRYLLFYALLLFCLNYVNFMGETIWGLTLKNAVGRAIRMGTAGGLDATQLTASVTAQYHFLYNLIALVVQLFLVSRIFQWIGVSGAVLVLPLISLGGYSLVGLGASLMAIKWVKSFENGVDYSLMNTTKGALFLITSREEKYKGKAAADTFFYRSGDAFAALTVFLLSSATVEFYAKVNVAVTAIWILLCLLVIREYRRVKSNAPSAAV